MSWPDLGDGKHGETGGGLWGSSGHPGGPLAGAGAVAVRAVVAKDTASGRRCGTSVGLGGLGGGRGPGWGLRQRVVWAVLGPWAGLLLLWQAQPHSSFCLNKSSCPCSWGNNFNKVLFFL